MTTIALVNYSTLLVEADLRPMTIALQTQLTRDLNALWGVSASLIHYLPGTPIPASRWVLGFFDDADQAGALGYHDVTPVGLPLGKVFVKTVRQDGASVSVVASHELIEMLVDPWINVFVQDEADAKKFWIREACDAVEGDADGYAINGVQVSDFVTPVYFEPTVAAGPWDFRQLLAGPIPTMLPSGYLAYVVDGQWGQVFGSAHRQEPGKAGGSGRVFRRMLGEPLRPSTYPVETA
jgi:hypothetical protein